MHHREVEGYEVIYESFRSSLAGGGFNVVFFVGNFMGKMNPF